MKKFILALALLGSAMSLTATPDITSLTLKMDRLGYYPAGGAVVNITPTDIEGEYTVSHFSGDLYSMPDPAQVKIDNEGNVTIAPQVLGRNYNGSLFWIIPDAAKGKAPAEFTAEDVITGKFENGKITINAWNVLVSSADSTQRQGVRHTDPLTSVIVAPNATITRGRWDDVYTSDWETFLRWEHGTMEEPAHVAYAEVNGDRLTVMNLDKLYAWAEFDLNVANGTFSIDPEQVVYRYWGSSNGDYVLAKIPAQLRTLEDKATGETVTGTIGDDQRTFTLTDVAVLKSTMQRIDCINGKPIYELTVTLDGNEETLIGDVNGDGVVDIDDVNIVVNVLLENVPFIAAADITGDGNVDIDDVNRVINAILNQ